MELIELSPEQQMREVAHMLLELANQLDRPDRREVIHIAAMELDLIAERLRDPNRN